MNIEDLIRAANPARTTDLPGGESPASRRRLDQIFAQAAAPGGRVRRPRRSLTPGRVGKWTLATVTLAATAAVAAVAIVVSMAPGPASRPAAAPRPSRAPSRPIQSPAAPPVSARELLLTAAAHVGGGPTIGNYWRVRLIGGLTYPAGTAAQPYDITVLTSVDQWNPRTPGDKEWDITQSLGARPATPDDAAVWRAAGSPTSWHGGSPFGMTKSWLAGFPAGWTGEPLDVTTSDSPATAGSTVSNGTVGYIEGDLGGLSAAQFAAMPTSEQGIGNVLNDYAQRSVCPYSGCSTKDQIIWSEALMLLQDPVSPQVRAATFRVMAALPGVKSLGQMTDPLGRTGYALAPADQEPNAAPENFNPLRVVLIDPQSGSLLATEELGPMPPTLHCLSFSTQLPSGNPDDCVGSAYQGRSYPNQVDDFIAVISDSWTNDSPVLPPPSRWTADLGAPGIPPQPLP